MPLDEYERKRDFARTPEPAGASGAAAPAGALAFVIHKHDSRRLHYDLRLELDGALASWAVPKGPSLDPAEKRLAVRVEDHPIEYGSFEGVIPKDEYGAGTVMLWDRGTWEPAGDPHEALARGDLKFTLHGEKLRGEWVLARMKRRGEEVKENWLLIKHRDEFARPGEGSSLLAEEDRSVASGRSMPEIAAGGSVWHTDAPATRQPDVRPAEEARLDPAALPGATRGKLPRFVEPQLALLVKDAPAGEEWLHEIKFDGYRAIARVADGKVTMYSRRENDWTDKFRSVADELARLPVREAMLDGEVCVTRPDDGITSFQLLQNELGADRAEKLVYFAFDLLFLDGYDLRGVALAERKSALLALLARLGPTSHVRYTEDIAGHGPEFFAKACELGLEGAVAKRAGSLYRPGRRIPDWVKVKCVQRQDFVIGGWTDPSGTRAGFGSLLLGVRDGGGLRYVGKVGTGFPDKLLAELSARLRDLATEKSPFTEGAEAIPKRVHWVRSELVGEVAFSEWTRDGHLRQPAFLGLREDKPASQVVAEKPAPTPATRTFSVLGIGLTHPDRVFYPDDGITKTDLAEYYARVGELMLPHVAHRPLALLRCPDGLGGGERGRGESCFYHKHAGDDFPQPLEHLTIRESEGPVPYLAVAEPAGLVALAQMAALEIHMWGSRADDVEHPDYMVFDLDPSEDVPWEAVNEGARLVRDVLSGLGLTSFVKTTGGKGLHVCVPLEPRTDWAGVKDFAEAVARAIAHYRPAKYVATMSKTKRTGRVFVDYLRNARSNTSIAPFSTRARPHATVSVPLRWDELSGERHSNDYTIANLARRLSRLRGDPWEGYFDVTQTITPTMRREIGLR